MMRQLIATLALAIPLFGQRALDLSKVQTVRSETIAFSPGGSIRIGGSYGSLTIEGWGRPEVEITVTKSLPAFRESGPQDLERERLDSVSVAMNRRSETELAIVTTLASRHGTWAPPLPAGTTRGVGMEYLIHVPATSRLEIQHGAGIVQVSGVTGNIQAAAKRGDIVLWLQPGTHSIEASTKMGQITSGYGGTTANRYRTGQRLVHGDPKAEQSVHLHTGFGGITILEDLPETVGPVPAEAR